MVVAARKYKLSALICLDWDTFYVSATKDLLWISKLELSGPIAKEQAIDPGGDGSFYGGRDRLRGFFNSANKRRDCL